MLKILTIWLFILPLNLGAIELKVGDILLQPLQCWTCSLIEAQENTLYSHMGLVIETKPQVKVVEAYGKVRILSLEEFNSRTKKNARLSVRRIKDERLVRLFEERAKKLKKYFHTYFENLPYDEEFLWDNVDQFRNEKLYCSEMVTKLLSSFFQMELPLKRMKFDIKREEWIRYFKGNPPDGMWGNSPADFERSNLFIPLGVI